MSSIDQLLSWLTFHHVVQKDLDTEQLTELPRMLGTAERGSTSPE